MALAFLCEAYDEEVVGVDKNGKEDVRTVLRHRVTETIESRRGVTAEFLTAVIKNDPLA